MQLTWFEDLVRAAGPQVATLLALIAANTLLGIAVSIKQRKFEWSQVANFYVDDVIPKLLGYLAIRLVVEFADLSFLGPDLASLVEGGFLGAAWLAIVVSFGGSILANIGALGIGLAAKLPGVKLVEPG
jgi:hypothetical protein